jgi:hypothetical protein
MSLAGDTGLVRLAFVAISALAAHPPAKSIHRMTKDPQVQMRL